MCHTSAPIISGTPAPGIRGTLSETDAKNDSVAGETIGARLPRGEVGVVGGDVVNEIALALELTQAPNGSIFPLLAQRDWQLTPIVTWPGAAGGRRCFN